MKMRYLSTLALATLLLYVLGAGCTQDFDAFQACSFGQKVCGDACVSVADPNHGCGPDTCSACSVANSDTVCDKSECAIGACQSPFENCDGATENGCEADLANDPLNCHACGSVCTTPHAQPACVAGNCAVGTCDPGWDDCDGEVATGCEANLDTDPLHCGDCETICPQFYSCQSGRCVVVCDPGFGDCDNDPSNGCETTLGTDDNCGFCGDECELANATESCSAGMCVIVTCAPGFDDCDGMDANGCEANLETSAATCGDCNTACPDGVNGTSVCEGGSCELNCNAGFGDCDGMAANGCETGTNENDQNCGECGLSCLTLANATAECNAGTCEITGCSGTFEDCNGNPADGCETNTNTSAAHCGNCGMPCTFANAAATCNMGTCQMGACNPGFADCNNNPADGCETNTSTSTGNCGACGRACSNANTAALMCTGGVCTSTCMAGFGNCSQPAAPAADNGCETATSSNVDHCGACGRACVGGNFVASKSCTGGVCTSTCAPGRANCSMPAAPAADNGCETNVTADDACGGCGNDCGAQGGGLDCIGGGATPLVCGCDGANGNMECNNGGAPGTCVAGGLCDCGGTVCNPGEVCVASGGNSVCGCDSMPGDAACAAGETCCENPAGCFDLQADPANCGACGHACPAGFICSDGVCACDSAADCNAGSAGVCNAGVCACGPMMTSCGSNPPGRRCQANGQCG